MLHVSGTVPQQSIDANYVFLRRLIVVNNRRITSTIDVNNRRKLRFSKDESDVTFTDGELNDGLDQGLQTTARGPNLAREAMSSSR